MKDDNDRYRDYATIATGWVKQKSYKELLQLKLKKGPPTFSRDSPFVTADRIRELEATSDYPKFVNDMINELDGDLELKIKYDYT